MSRAALHLPAYKKQQSDRRVESTVGQYCLTLSILSKFQAGGAAGVAFEIDTNEKTLSPAKGRAHPRRTRALRAQTYL